jgi:hypothetical protein
MTLKVITAPRQLVALQRPLAHGFHTRARNVVVKAADIREVWMDPIFAYPLPLPDDTHDVRIVCALIPVCSAKIDIIYVTLIK